MTHYSLPQPSFHRNNLLRTWLLCPRVIRISLLPFVTVFLVLLLAAPNPACARSAESIREAFRQQISAEERAQFDAYRAAQVFHAAASDAYWALVEKKRALRRTKKARGRPLLKTDYAQKMPPDYTGPSLSRSLAAKWRKFQERFEEKTPEVERSTLPTVADFLDSARRHFDFVPERIPENTFKERYAREALAHGLTGDQVVRVYALETSGLGSADMQAVNRNGVPISTALGYAQLLAANSVSEIAKHGREFVDRLREMARRAPEGSRDRKRLVAKARSLERMVYRARKLPFKWSRHVAFAKTDVGRGIHAVNIDGDIGPWIQVIKLKGLKEMASKAGRSRLTGAEIELMNLAGPGTGLEMMEPVARTAPSTNFFARDAYYRNTIVRGKTAAELIQALDDRMEVNLKNSGAVEFTRIFKRLEGKLHADR
ncbi:MAG: hypothetical protein KDJ37_02860 [Hyphomicrobiaceae bacterium]|nr:hypothetical protein [Hyphomicrobiaceae bacterium]